MKVILEKSDIISLLGKAMGRSLNSDLVEVHLEPFEVVIHDASNILVEPTPVPAPTETKPTAAPPVTEDTDDALTMDDLLAQSRSLTMTDPKKVRNKKRGRMAGEYDEPINPLTGGDDD